MKGMMGDTTNTEKMCERYLLGLLNGEGVKGVKMQPKFLQVCREENILSIFICNQDMERLIQIFEGEVRSGSSVTFGEVHRAFDVSLRAV